MAKLFARGSQSVPEVKLIFEAQRIMCWSNALPIPRMKRSLSGSSCCWIRRCSLSAVRWKIEPVYPPYEPVAGVLITQLIYLIAGWRRENVLSGLRTVLFL
ncbi:hypothetical protein KCP76_16310 [Salmonella enterica subsp. enterica serovar Weltevreden]|nr:hypothetical protein KCP76_16310 [Salmonella enterica subsp. enterica serovar Weltevreden]